MVYIFFFLLSTQKCQWKKGQAEKLYIRSREPVRAVHTLKDPIEAIRKTNQLGRGMQDSRTFTADDPRRR